MYCLFSCLELNCRLFPVSKIHSGVIVYGTVYYMISWSVWRLLISKVVLLSIDSYYR